MNPYIMLGIVLFWLASLLGAEQYGVHARGIKDDLKAAQLQLAEDRLINDARNANDALTTKLEIDHANSEAALNTLLSAPAPRVLLPSTCADKANATSGGIQTEQANGILPTEAERILGSDRQRTWSNIGEAEQELNDCRVAKNWAAAQASSVK